MCNVYENVLPTESDKIMSGITVGYNSYIYSDNEGTLYVHNLNSGDLKWKKELKDLAWVTVPGLWEEE